MEPIKKIEEEVSKEITKEIQETEKTGLLKTPWIQSVISMVLIFGILGTFLYWMSVRNTVYIENSYLDAPTANVSPSTPGTLNAIYVKVGDQVLENQQIALVGSEVVYAKNNGVISAAPEVVGSYYNPGQTLISITDNSKMEVVGSVDETNSLDKILPGERVNFSVDAFPGKIYTGIVNTVSPVSENTGVVFSISDNRPIRKFDVKVNFDHTKYTELKSGMSAKMTIYVNN